MKFFRNFKELKAVIKSLPKNEPVWRGEDGSYAVGRTFPANVEEGGTEYVEAGKVEEYR